MNHRVAYMVFITLLGVAPVTSIAQGPPQEIVTPQGKVITPATSVVNPADRGQRAHTNHLIFQPQKGPPFRSSTPAGETPGSLACVYGTTSQTTDGCSITGKVSDGNNGNSTADGGSGIIAIVDAYDYPSAENDLESFSSQFGLGSCTTGNGCFQRVFASGRKPRPN